MYTQPCNYAANKLKTQQLYRSYQVSPTPATELEFINFLKDSLLPCWYGTKWDFNGITEQPGEGAIACGFFVTTVLRDAGIHIARIKMAQCASEEMIKTVCDRSTIHRYSNLSINDFVDKAKQLGEGLFVIGLDNHTGFIVNDTTGCFFIHSNYIQNAGVMKEDALRSIPLRNSKYRVIGKVKL